MILLNVTMEPRRPQERHAQITLLVETLKYIFMGNLTTAQLNYNNKCKKIVYQKTY